MYHHRNQACKSRFTKVYNQDLRRPVHVQLKRTTEQQQLAASPEEEPAAGEVLQRLRPVAPGDGLPEGAAGQAGEGDYRSEKTALSESLKLAVFHAKDLQRDLEEKHKVLVVEGGSMKKKRNSFSLKRPASVASSESGSSSECSSSSAAHLKRCRFESGSSSNSSSVSSSKK
ncbi:hypothetical protein TYRP_011731 [Tyrophagus putrescentiae]|nr:hypothetical protein TYRP_011731 [Tyrophagus putrescentiae]